MSVPGSCHVPNPWDTPKRFITGLLLRKEHTARLIALLEEVSNAVLEKRPDDPDFQLPA
jgi:hypothetical protein